MTSRMKLKKSLNTFWKDYVALKLLSGGRQLKELEELQDVCQKNWLMM